MKKICMVATSFLDYDSRILNEANTLAKFYDLTILTKKYNRPTILQSTSFKIKRVYYSQGWLRWYNIFSSLIALTIATFKENPDVYHAHDLDGLICAYWPALIKKKILIYDSHELWSDLWSAKKYKIQWLLRIIERIAMWKVEKGVTVSRSLARILSGMYQKQFVTISNYPVLHCAKTTVYNLGDKYTGMTIVLHIGTMSNGRGIENLIEANQYLPTNFLIVFLGTFNNIDRLINLVKEKHLEKRVIFKASVGDDQLLSIARMANIGVVLTQNLSLSYYYSLPNKLFQYIAAEIPILASDLPTQKAIILEDKIGQVVDSSQPRQIAAKIMELAKPENQKKYRQNLKGLAKRKYNWTIESKKLVEFYKTIV